MKDGQLGRQVMAASNIRVMLRIVTELHTLSSDPVLRKIRLLKGLCEITKAHGGVCTVAHAAGRDAGQVVSTVAVGESFTQETALPPEAVALAPSLASRWHRPILSSLSLPGRQLQAEILLSRTDAQIRPFSLTERRIAHLFHEEVAWIYGLDLPLASPEVALLPPRQRQALQLLLAGHSEKQAAKQMSVTTNTLHHYVKAIYRHFEVNSRSELLAKWVRSEEEQPPPDSVSAPHA